MQTEASYSNLYFLFQDIRAFNKDINSCTAMLYREPKTDHKLLVMDCQR